MRRGPSAVDGLGSAAPCGARCSRAAPSRSRSPSLGAASAHAQAPATSVLVFHGRRRTPTNDAGVAAIQALGADERLRGRRRRRTPATSRPRTWRGLRRRRVPELRGRPAQRRPGGARCRTSSRTAAASSASAPPPRPSPASTFFNGLIGARPDPASPGATTEQTVVAGDRVHPGDARPAADVQPLRRLVPLADAPDGHRSTPSRATTRPNAPAGDGTAVGGTDHPISWCRDFQGGRSFYTGMGRTDGELRRGRSSGRTCSARIEWAAGIGARRLQGDDRRELHGDRGCISRRAREHRASPRAASRTASWSRRTAGCSTSAAATAAPTPPAARCSAATRSGASSTTPIRASASAAAASTSGIPRSTTARSTAA